MLLADTKIQCNKLPKSWSPFPLESNTFSICLTYFYEGQFNPKYRSSFWHPRILNTFT